MYNLLLVRCYSKCKSLILCFRKPQEGAECSEKMVLQLQGD